VSVLKMKYMAWVLNSLLTVLVLLSNVTLNF